MTRSTTCKVLYLRPNCFRRKKKIKNKINVVLMSLNERNELLKIQCTWASLCCTIPHLPSSFPITKKKRKKKTRKNVEQRNKIRTHVHLRRKLDWEFRFEWITDGLASRDASTRCVAMETRLFHGTHALATFRDRSRCARFNKCARPYSSWRSQ